MTVAEITEKLQLARLVNRAWHIQPAIAITKEGIQEGFEWLYQKMVERERVWCLCGRSTCGVSAGQGRSRPCALVGVTSAGRPKRCLLITTEAMTIRPASSSTRRSSLEESSVVSVAGKNFRCISQSSVTNLVALSGESCCSTRPSRGIVSTQARVHPSLVSWPVRGSPASSSAHVVLPSYPVLGWRSDPG